MGLEAQLTILCHNFNPRENLPPLEAVSLEPVARNGGSVVSTFSADVPGLKKEIAPVCFVCLAYAVACVPTFDKQAHAPKCLF